MDSFINWDNWWAKKYSSKLGLRYPTFQLALNLLKQRNGSTILETGTLRQEDDWGGGCSTLIFSDYLNTYGGKLYTVDISERNIEVSRKCTKAFSNTIEYIVSDSIAYLNRFSEKIDLLYLDSMDCSEPPKEATDSQMHSLNEFKTIENKLHDKTIVMLDDNAWINGGKTKLTKEYLVQKGWTCLLDYQQTIWIKN